MAASPSGCDRNEKNVRGTDVNRLLLWKKWKKKEKKKNYTSSPSPSIGARKKWRPVERTSLFQTRCVFFPLLPLFFFLSFFLSFPSIPLFWKIRIPVVSTNPKKSNGISYRYDRLAGAPLGGEDEEETGDSLKKIKKERKRKRKGISSWDSRLPETFHGSTSVPSSTSGMIGSRRVVRVIFSFFFFFPSLLEGCYVFLRHCRRRTRGERNIKILFRWVFKRVVGVIL